jgi:hypothetical protein
VYRCTKCGEPWDDSRAQDNDLSCTKRCGGRPLPCEDRVQVTGHVRVPKPEVDAVRIRLDTSGNYEHNPLTACLLRSASAEPVFIASR